MPLYSAQVIILRRRDFQETDKVVTAYTREFGKLSAIAKGARRSTSRLVGATEPLVYARMQLATGRNFDIISEAVIKHAFSGLRSTRQRIGQGMYLAELTDALVDERQSSPELFDLLLSSLYLLEGRIADAATILRFQMQALDIAGYSPEVNRCAHCQAVRPAGRPAAFSPSLGGIVCNRCLQFEDIPKSPAQVLDAMQQLCTLPASGIQSFSLAPEDLGLLRRLVSAHIRFHIERDLKTEALLTQPG